MYVHCVHLIWCDFRGHIEKSVLYNKHFASIIS